MGLVQVAETNTCTHAHTARGHILDYPGSDRFFSQEVGHRHGDPSHRPVSILWSGPFVWVTETNMHVTFFFSLAK